MSKTLEFKVFCFEAYRAEKKLTGYETMELFKKYGVLQYLEECYDVLHTSTALRSVFSFSFTFQRTRIPMLTHCFYYGTR